MYSKVSAQLCFHAHDSDEHVGRLARRGSVLAILNRSIRWHVFASMQISSIAAGGTDLNWWADLAVQIDDRRRPRARLFT